MPPHTTPVGFWPTGTVYNTRGLVPRCQGGDDNDKKVCTPCTVALNIPPRKDLSEGVRDHTLTIYWDALPTDIERARIRKRRGERPFLDEERVTWIEQQPGNAVPSAPTIIFSQQGPNDSSRMRGCSARAHAQDEKEDPHPSVLPAWTIVVQSSYRGA